MCSLEFPDLDHTARERGDDLLILGVAPSGEGLETVNAFLDQTGVSFPIVRDDDSLRHRIEFPSALSPYPRQVLIGPDGRVEYVASEHRDSELEAALDRVLR